MKKSNELSCCLKCFETKGEYFRSEYYCKNDNCDCHKPSVEVSKCCGAERGKASGNILFDNTCVKCGKRFEPQSIPLDRDEGEEKCCCYSYDCELGCRERQCCCIPEYTHKVKDHTPLKYRDFFEKKFPTPKLTPENTEMEEWENKLKDEYRLYIGSRCIIHPDFFPDECCGTPDWWLSKIHTLQEEYKKELIEKIEKELKKEYTPTYPNPVYYQDMLAKHYNDGIDDIINIIKQ